MKVSEQELPLLQKTLCHQGTHKGSLLPVTVAGISSSTICIIVYFTHFSYYIDRSFSKQGIRKLVTEGL